MADFTVIGLGRFGTQISKKLSSLGAQVMSIDIREDLVDAVADHVTRAVVADARNKDVLMSLGVQNRSHAIVAIATDISASVLVTMNLKSIGVKTVICKAQDTTHAEILKKIGADQVLIPEKLIADKLARNLVSPNLLEYMDISDGYSIIEAAAPSKWIGKTIREIDIRAKYGVNIIAIRSSDAMKVAPGADAVLAKGDALIMVGENSALGKIEKLDGKGDKT